MTAPDVARGAGDDAWDWHDEDDDPRGPDEYDPEELADPSCIDCGGKGGWCGSFDEYGQCIWVDCHCIEWEDTP